MSSAFSTKNMQLPVQIWRIGLCGNYVIDVHTGVSVPALATDLRSDGSLGGGCNTHENLPKRLTHASAVIEAADSRLNPSSTPRGTTVLGVLPMLQDVFCLVLAVTIFFGLIVSTMRTTLSANLSDGQFVQRRRYAGVSEGIRA